VTTIDPRISPPLIRRIYKANLVAQAAIVVTGAVVRITGSGLGCPTWPQCVEGSYVPTSRQVESELHKYIEFGNRLLTFVLAALAIAAVVAAIIDARRRSRNGLPRRRSLTVLATIPLIGTIIQAVLGGITVLTQLNPVTVSAHFLVSMVLIAACVLLVARSGDPVDSPTTWLVPPPVRLLGWLVIAVTSVVVVLGVIVTGSGPHSGDAEVEARFSFDPRTVAWLHADSVLLMLGLLIGFAIAVRVTTSPKKLNRRINILLVVVLIQGFVGYLQYFTGLPELLVSIHVLGAVLVWTAALFVLPAMGIKGGELDQERVNSHEQEDHGQVGN
jgi:heme a synthase